MTRWRNVSLCVGLLACVVMAGTVTRAREHFHGTGFSTQQVPLSGAARMERGAAVFQNWCATCHSAGWGMAGTQALAAKYHGNPPALLLERTDLTPELVAYFVRHGVSVMPPFRKTEISDADLAALGAYLARARPASPDTAKH